MLHGRKTKRKERQMDVFSERDFRQRIASAIEKARTVLALGTNPELPQVANGFSWSMFFAVVSSVWNDSSK